MNKNAAIYIAGHTGMVGSSVLRLLIKLGYENLITISSRDVDLRSQEQTERFFKKNRIEYVFLAAAKVGGILANDELPAHFLYDNIMIASNVIHAAKENNVIKLLNLGSSCIYPRLAEQPMDESMLLTGKLEPTNEPYAIAKIAAIKMCDAYRKQFGCNFISAMPTNLYGPNDNYHLQYAHVVPALIRKFHEGKKNENQAVTIWGSGKPCREFLHVDDMASACLFLMENYDSEGFVNVGTGVEISIKELAHLIAEIVGFQGEIEFDTSKPDGTPRKLLNVSKLQELGWQASINLRDGITSTYEACRQLNWY